MLALHKWTAILLLTAGMATGGTASHASADGHADSHAEGHSGGKGKGPKYMGGGDHGDSHSSSSHKGGSQHHDSSEGGSKSMEDKVFHGGTGGHETDTGDGGTEHSH